jgi:hypothetical protein
VFCEVYFARFCPYLAVFISGKVFFMMDRLAKKPDVELLRDIPANQGEISSFNNSVLKSTVSQMVVLSWFFSNECLFKFLDTEMRVAVNLKQNLSIYSLVVNRTGVFLR